MRVEVGERVDSLRRKIEMGGVNGVERGISMVS